jgi:hypothetical protein
MAKTAGLMNWGKNSLLFSAVLLSSIAAWADAPPEQPGPVPIVDQSISGSSFSVGGVVFKPDGSPAAGARVWASTDYSLPNGSAAGITDEFGRFQFRLATLAEGGGWSIGASLGNLGRVDVNAKENANASLIEVRLEPQGNVRFRILAAESGSPLTQALLFIDTGEIVQTDAQGEVVVSGVPQKEHEMFVVCPGRVRQRSLFDNSLQAEMTLELRIESAGKVNGMILDEQGNPVPSAYIERQTSGSGHSL